MGIEGRCVSVTILCIFCLACWMGCGETVDTSLNAGPQDIRAYLPYRTGDTYSLRVDHGFGDFIDTIVYVVQNDTALNGKFYLEHDLISSRNALINFEGSNGSKYYRISGDTLFTWEPDDVESVFAIFSMRRDSSLDDIQPFKYVSDTSILVPAGSFTSVKHLQRGAYPASVYFAKGVGLVYSDYSGKQWLLSAKIGGKHYGR